MKFSIAKLLILTAVCCVMAAAYSYETSVLVEVDASYSMPVKVVPSKHGECQISYVMIDTNDLDSLEDRWSNSEYFFPERRKASVKYPDLPGIVHVTDNWFEVTIPITLKVSPIRRIVHEKIQPWNCIVFFVLGDSEQGASSHYKYESNWKGEDAIVLDVDEFLPVRQP